MLGPPRRAYAALQRLQALAEEQCDLASDMSKWVVPELRASVPSLSVTCVAPGRPDNWLPFLYTSPAEYPRASATYLRSHKDDDGNQVLAKLHADAQVEPQSAAAPALTIVGGSAMISAMLLLVVVARRSKILSAQLV